MVEKKIRGMVCVCVRMHVSRVRVCSHGVSVTCYVLMQCSYAIVP